MSMHFPYGNTNTTGQRSYGTAVCPTFGINYNPYFSPAFFANSNGLLPTPNRPGELVPKPLLSTLPYGPRPVNTCTDFLTFIEQKTRATSELNPYANEFSLGRNSSNPFVSNRSEKIASYKLIFDDLIEKSLQSIDAIEKASKITSHHHVSTQCEPSIDRINRSTQTDDDYDHRLEEYTSAAVKLMKNFQYVLQISSSDSLNSLYDEFSRLIFLINQLIPSSSSSLINDTNTRLHRSEMIDPVRIKPLKSCLLCRKALDHHDDLMHPFCRLFSGID